MADVIVIPAGDIALSLDSSAGSADLTLQVAGEVSLALDNAQGPAGPPGPPGPIGESILGEVLLANAVSELPTTGEIGDCYLIPNSSLQNELYVWDGLGWTNVGPIQGPQGEPGEVTLAATQTLLNKTLVNPVLNNPSLSSAVISDGTVGGVLYLNASKQVLASSTLTFNGTLLSTSANFTISSNLPRINLNKTGVLASLNFIGSNSGMLAYSSDASNEAASSGHQWLVDGEEKARLTSNGFLGLNTDSPTGILDIAADTIRLRTARTPSSSSATGVQGEVCWDASYLYVCVATNTWKRTAISSW